MQVAVSIIIFILIAGLLAVLFKLNSWYFRTRHQHAAQQLNQAYQLNDCNFDVLDDVIDDGEYVEFVEKRQKEKLVQASKKTNPYLYKMDTTKQSIEPFKEHNSEFLLDNSVNLQGKLFGETISTQRNIMQKSTWQELVTIASIDPDKMPSCTGRRRNGLNRKQNSTKRQFSYITQLVAYSEQGLKILTQQVLSLCKQKQSDKITTNKKIDEKHITSDALQFQLSLEVLGFEQGIYGAYKYTYTVDISQLRPGQPQYLDNFNCREQKQEIDLLYFYVLRSQILSEPK